ncbi:DUF3429 family protein [Gammaproteobacteria bacterium AB-CW1]|uniref:DUF3429 family protein n=1 Tax=Natronospira elongata TaxID=3110268 RepID=A0AAP6JH32_9GAMM|nr:DUF3429 family protein [Gammaproteobacteria bacterium AB-CW1]
MSEHDQAEHESAIREAARSARVVAFCSNLTETGLLQRAAEQRGEPYREIRMGMADAAMRERFQYLKTLTGQTTLPQVFVEGQFIGGIEDYLKRDEGQPYGEVNHARRWVEILAYAGLLPFLAGALGLLLLAAGITLPVGLGEGFFIQWQLAYGAVILSFLGATHWGMGLAGGRGLGKGDFLAAVLPALLAWLSLLLPSSPGLMLLIAGFVLWWLYEYRISARLAYAGWYQAVRRNLSWTVAGLLLLSLLFIQ